MKTLRVGLIGLGTMGKHHLRVLSSLSNVQLVGVFDPYPGDFPIHQKDLLVSEFDALIARKPDYCVVAAPTILHAEIGTRLAKSRIHTLIEKPLASNLDEAISLVQAFEEAELIGGVGHIERYNPALQEAKKRIASGQLGRVHQIATSRQGPFPSRVTDVGVVKDLASHDIDLTSWLVGQQYQRVSAETSVKSGRKYEDFVVAVGALMDGTIANHIVNWLSPMKERTTVITGETGSLVADTLNADLTFFANGAVDVIRDDVATFRGVREGDVIRYAFPKPEPLRLEHENFRDALMNLESNIVTMRHGLETVRVAEALLESSKNGQVVKLREASL